jgi:hypothetical protein
VGRTNRIKKLGMSREEEKRDRKGSISLKVSTESFHGLKSKRPRAGSQFSGR